MRVLDKNTISIYHLSILTTYMKRPYQHVAILFPTTDDQGNASIITKLYNLLNVLKAIIYFKIRIIYERGHF
jgi:hypothetical protein